MTTIMDEWEVYIDFKTHKGKAFVWFRDEKGVLSYCKKHFPRCNIIYIKNLTQERSNEK